MNLSRTDKKRAITETFGYDGLNRLSRLGEHDLVYDKNGNIKTMPLIGELSYTHESKPYAVTGLTPLADLAALPEQELTFTSFQRAKSITENGIKANFLYNAAGERVRMQLEKEGMPQLSRYYLSPCSRRFAIGACRREKIMLKDLFLWHKLLNEITFALLAKKFTPAMDKKEAKITRKTIKNAGRKNFALHFFASKPLKLAV